MKALASRWRWWSVWSLLLLGGAGLMITLGPGNAYAHCGTHDTEPDDDDSCDSGNDDDPDCCPPEDTCCPKKHPGWPTCEPPKQTDPSSNSDPDPSDSGSDGAEGGEDGSGEDSSGGSCEEQSSDDPIRLFSGELKEDKYFLRLGGSLAMKVVFTYSSSEEMHTAAGYGWTLNYFKRLYDVSDTNKPYLVRMGNGSRIDFEPVGSNAYRSLDTKNYTLTVNTNGTFTMRSKSHITYDFDTGGRLTSLGNGKGAELRMTYNPTGKVAIVGRSRYSNLTNNMVLARDDQLTHVEEYLAGTNSGRYYDLYYSTNGYVTNIADSAARSIALTYSSAGELLQILDPVSNAYTYAYNELGKMATLVGLGCSDCVQVTNQYDSTGRVTNQVQGTQGNGTVTRVEYVGASETHVNYTIRIPGGASIRLRSEGRRFVKDVYGKSRLETKTTDFGYGVTNVVQYWYDTNALRTQALVNGIATNVFGYDGNKNLTYRRLQVSSNVFLITTRTYDGNNNLLTNAVYQTDQSGSVFKTVFRYDAQNRLTNRVAVLVGTNLVTRMDYNGFGRVTNNIDPRGNAISYEYANGYVVREYDPASTNHQIFYRYDAAGNMTNRIDALGRVWKYEYDGLSRRTREIDPLGQETVWTYGEANLVEVERGIVGITPGRLTIYEYNGLNKLTAIKRENDQGTPVLWEARVPDSSGKILVRTNALGRTFSNTYNNVGLKVQTVDEYGAVTLYGYDAWGNMTQTVNAIGVTNWMQYDYLKRLTNRLEAVGELEQRVTGYRYTAQGDRIQITQPDGSATYFTYDLAGRMTAASGTLQYARSNVYDGNGNLIVSIDGNGNRVTNTYDVYNRPVSVRYPDGVVESNVYDEVGNRVRFIDGNTNITYFVYDSLNHLASRSVPNDSNTLIITYAYDAWNEILQVSNVAGGVQQSFFDRLGRMTNSIDAAGLSLAYNYDVLDQVICTRWPNGTTISNVYDNMRLTSTQDRAGNSRPMSSTRSEGGYGWWPRWVPQTASRTMS